MIKAKVSKKKKQRINRASTCTDVEFWDRFSTPIGFSVGDGIYEYNSFWGACFSAVILILTTLYCFEKIFIQEQLSSYSVTKFYESKEKIPFGMDSFNLAFVFTDYHTA